VLTANTGDKKIMLKKHKKTPLLFDNIKQFGVIFM
jgi:hypothetical protein